MIDAGQKSLLREPDAAFPQKYTIRKAWARTNNMPLPGFMPYYF